MFTRGTGVQGFDTLPYAICFISFSIAGPFTEAAQLATLSAVGERGPGAGFICTGYSRDCHRDVFSMDWFKGKFTGKPHI